MPDCVQLIWHENVLKFMEHEIRAAKNECRDINKVSMCAWVQFIRTTKTTLKKRKAIAEGLALLLDDMPNDAATLFAKLEIKTLMHQLNEAARPRQRNRQTSLSVMAP